MNVAETIEAIRLHVASARAAGQSIGLAPTMGALHEGHLSLIEAARRACDFVVVSIFVNPTQFAEGEDLAAYPHTFDADLAACETLGAAVVFAPSVEEMYGCGSLTEVSVRQLTETLCGRIRAGHFTGVCTVVAKLFNIVQPDKAFFGAKDFQQAVVIRRMACDLNFPVEIVVCPTVREADGLARSSRNAYLSGEQRTQAAALHESLKVAEEMIYKSTPPAAEVIAAIRKCISERASDGEIDYVQIVDPDTLRDVETTDRNVLIALAVRIGRARLIDNARVDGGNQCV